MNDVSQWAICLKLNKHWIGVGVATVEKTIKDLVSGVLRAVDIGYELNEDGTPNTNEYTYARPVDWDEWVTLPIRSWDIPIHSPRMVIRVPTVTITKKYDKIPTKKYKGKPTREALFYRDDGKDIYTNQELDFDESTIDHIIPLSRGGTDTFENTGLTLKKTNNTKGNRLNKEVGLKLKFAPTVPKEVPIWKTIRKIRHIDWKFFIKH